MFESVCDPIFLTQDSWRVDYEFLCFGIVSDGGFHFDGVVSVSQFGKAEAANDLTAVDFIKVLGVSLSMQSSHGSAE